MRYLLFFSYNVRIYFESLIVCISLSIGNKMGYICANIRRDCDKNAETNFITIPRKLGCIPNWADEDDQ